MSKLAAGSPCLVHKTDFSTFRELETPVGELWPLWRSHGLGNVRKGVVEGVTSEVGHP